MTLPVVRAPTRIIGIDDGPFARQQGETAPLVAVLLAGPHLERVHVGRISVDGMDATEVALSLLKGWRPAPILLSGVSFGGFNLINPRVLQRKFRVPVIVLVGSRPNNTAVKQALVKHFPDWKQRWKIIRSLGPLRQARTNPDEPPVYYEAFGLSPRESVSLLNSTSFVSRIPEPVRVAGLLARGLYPLEA